MACQCVKLRRTNLRPRTTLQATAWRFASPPAPRSSVRHLRQRKYTVKPSLSPPPASHQTAVRSALRGAPLSKEFAGGSSSMNGRRDAGFAGLVHTCSSQIPPRMKMSLPLPTFALCLWLVLVKIRFEAMLCSPRYSGSQCRNSRSHTPPLPGPVDRRRSNAVQHKPITQPMRVHINE